MDIINIFIGILLILLGIFIIMYFVRFVDKKHKWSGSVRLVGGGIGFILLGIGLIIFELKKII